MKINKQTSLFMVLIIAWYVIILIPYEILAELLGRVNLGNGRSWPLSFFLMDALVISIFTIFIVMIIKGWSRKTLKLYWILFALLLIYPLITVWATLEDLIFSPIVINEYYNHQPVQPSTAPANHKYVYIKDQKIMIFDLGTQTTRQILPEIHDVSDFQWSADGKLLIITPDNTLFLYDTKNGQQRILLKNKKGTIWGWDTSNSFIVERRFNEVGEIDTRSAITNGGIHEDESKTKYERITIDGTITQISQKDALAVHTNVSNLPTDKIQIDNTHQMFLLNTKNYNQEKMQTEYIFYLVNTTTGEKTMLGNPIWTLFVDIPFTLTPDGKYLAYQFTENFTPDGQQQQTYFILHSLIDNKEVSRLPIDFGRLSPNLPL